MLSVIVDQHAETYPWNPVRKHSLGSVKKLSLKIANTDIIIIGTTIKTGCRLIHQGERRKWMLQLEEHQDALTPSIKTLKEGMVETDALL